MEPYDEQCVVDEAWKFLRGNTTGAIRFGDHVQKVAYVICPDSTMIISAMVAMLQPQDMVMYIPDYAEDCMEMHVTLEQFVEEGEDGQYADRWQVYHGEPPDVQWAKVSIDAVRFHEMFVEGESLMHENVLANHESSLCKQVNENTQSLIDVCKRHAHVEVESPMMVGVDPFGIDVRARFGIVRVEPAAKFEQASDVLNFVDCDS